MRDALRRSDPIAATTTIERTVSFLVVLRDDPAEAERAYRSICAHNGMEAIGGMLVLLGPPAVVWVRAGYFRASGDEDRADDEHGTFFPMLPTVRRFSQTTVYGTMNLNETFVMLQARPQQTLGLRLDLRRVDLASAADLWYAGSGATLGEGNVFGYTGRRSNGSTRLGTEVEASADYAITPRVAVNAFLGTIGGGRVVTGTFQGDRLWYGYIETALSFSTR